MKLNLNPISSTSVSVDNVTLHIDRRTRMGIFDYGNITGEWMERDALIDLIQAEFNGVAQAVFLAAVVNVDSPYFSANTQ